MSTKNINLNIPLITVVLILMDFYVFYVLKHSLKKFQYKIFVNIAYIISALCAYVGFYFLTVNFEFHPLQSNWLKNIFIGFFFSFLVFKLVMIAFFLMEDILRLVKLTFHGLIKWIHKPERKVELSGRRKFVRQAGLAMAAIPFSSMIYGITKGKYNFKIHSLVMPFENLPKAFNGLKIVQISDIHSGSFDDIEAIRDGIQLINDQQPDLILFTGDLVNYDAREIIPFTKEFKKLKSKMGVYSVLGNHDYGDYKSWNTEAEKTENNQMLHYFHKEMNFNLLNNENIVLEKGGDKIGLVGVENWGHKPFVQAGDLDKATEGLEEVPFKILMSHDPTHWREKVIQHPVQFDLTLSGHTHGMQFGVDIPGFKWSPVKYIYPNWAGLYESSKQFLYVNRGFGYIGFPGRAGIWPEITVIELQSTSA